MRKIKKIIEGSLYRNKPEIVEKAEEKIHSCTIQFIAIMDDSKHVPVGSGVLIETAQSGYIVTARHIWSKWKNRVYVNTHTGACFQPEGESIIIGMKDAYDHVDQAIIQLPALLHEEISRVVSFLSVDDAVPDYGLDPNTIEYFFLHGYPNSKTKDDDKMEQIVSESFTYLAAENFEFEFLKYGLNPHDNYAIEYNKKMYRKVDNNTRIVPQIQGMSGCGLWALTEINNTHCVLLGILIERIYDQYPNQALICVRIDFALAAIWEHFEKHQICDEPLHRKWVERYWPKEFTNE